MKKITIIVFLLFIGNAAMVAQKFELGKVTVDELKETKHPKDTSAVAAYLFNIGKTYFEYSQEKGFSIKTEVNVKIKIYKKEGYAWANRSMPYYAKSGSKESVFFSKAITYNLVNGEIEKTKLKSEGEFTETVNEFWGVKKIAMPNVKEGSVIEYSYIYKTPFISSVKEWDFQKTIPVNHTQYDISVPEYFVYNRTLKGSLQPKIFDVKNQKDVTLNNKETTGGTSRSPQKTTYSVEKIGFTESKTIYILDDVSAIKEEAFVNNIDNYTSSVTHELLSTQYPNQPYENYATNWQDVSKKIYEDSDFGQQVNKNNYYEEDVKKITEGLSTTEEKVKAIFSFVKDKMNWNKTYGIFCKDGVKKAYQDKTGNSAEINLMLVSMLRHANITANPILISTRSNGIALYPSRTAFNHVIAGVKNGQEIILLDATFKNSLANILPEEDLNWIGRMIEKDGTSEEIDLMPKKNSANILNMLVKIDNEGVVSGQLREQYFDYRGFKFREKYSILTNDTYLEQLEKENKGLEVQNYERINDKELDKPIIETYGIKTNNAVEKIGDKMYFSPLIYLTMNANPFKQEIREYPIDFGYTTSDKYYLNITIPEGYQVETVPTQQAYSMPDGYGSFKYMISNMDDIIQVAISLDINAAIFPADDYSILKEFFKKVIEKENEKIVLKKI